MLKLKGFQIAFDQCDPDIPESPGRSRCKQSASWQHTVVSANRTKVAVRTTHGAELGRSVVVGQLCQLIGNWDEPQTTSRKWWEFLPWAARPRHGLGKTVDTKYLFFFCCRFVFLHASFITQQYLRGWPHLSSIPSY